MAHSGQTSFSQETQVIPFPVLSANFVAAGQQSLRRSEGFADDGRLHTQESCSAKFPVAYVIPCATSLARPLGFMVKLLPPQACATLLWSSC